MFSFITDLLPDGLWEEMKKWMENFQAVMVLILVGFGTIIWLGGGTLHFMTYKCDKRTWTALGKPFFILIDKGLTWAKTLGIPEAWKDFKEQRAAKKAAKDREHVEKALKELTRPGTGQLSATPNGNIYDAEAQDYD